MCVCVGACADFTVAEPAGSTATSGATSGSGGGATSGATSGSGGGATSGATSGSGGGDGTCGKPLNFSGQLGSPLCQQCATDKLCSELLECEERGCVELLSCFQGCGCFQNTPCLKNCNMQFDAGTGAAFSEVAQRLSDDCFGPCGFSQDPLCNTPFPAVTSNCKSTAEQNCCSVVTACGNNFACQACANGMNMGMECEQHRLFQDMVNCLTLPPHACSY
jgi:hypothetical protein